jgi:hypothetical protein
MRSSLIKATIATVVLGLGLVAARQVWSVGTAAQLWREGDWWMVRVERAQVFRAEPSPPWAEVNRVRFEVLRVAQGVAGVQLQLRLTFAKAVLDGYDRLELVYDGRSLAPVSGQLLGDGLPAQDWATVRPLLDADLFSLDGLKWRRASHDTVGFRPEGLDQDVRAYRVTIGSAEYGWSDTAPWWLWYASRDQIRAELVDCSRWKSDGAPVPEVLPPLENVPATPAAVPVPTRVLDYTLLLQAGDSSGLTTVAERSGELAFDGGLGTQVISLAWGQPQQRMHVYVSLTAGSNPAISLDKAVITEPAYAVRLLSASAVLEDGHASLETSLAVGKKSHVLSLRCTLR